MSELEIHKLDEIAEEEQPSLILIESDITTVDLPDSPEAGEIESPESPPPESVSIADNIANGCTVNANKPTATADVQEIVDTEEPLIKIIFRDGAFKSYAANLIKSIVETIPGCDVQHAEEQIDGKARSILNVHVISLTPDDVFQFDKTPTGKNVTASIPRYRSSTQKVLQEGEEPERKEPNTKTTQNECFNCGGPHSMRDCKEPRDHRRINQARSKFQTKTERYHVDVKQKYGHYLPGQISNDLRQALGLHYQELPVYIYRMRTLGYPPGWLEEAKVQHSGIALFDSKGKKTIESDEEDGEVDLVKHKYDMNKIVEFPGFNVETPEGYRDDHIYFGMPARMSEQSKSYMMKHLQQNAATAYKRRKMKHTPIEQEDNNGDANHATKSAHLSETILEPSNMEVEDSDEEAYKTVSLFGAVESLPPPLPEPANQPLPPPPPEFAANVDSISCELNSDDSQTLVELQRKQEQLLKDLQETAMDSSIDDSLIADILELDRTVGEPPQHSDSSVEMPVTPQRGSSAAKSVAVGTPILQSVSPYEKLPSGNAFSQGVSDVINFENLPESTGRYEHLRGLLRSVRRIVNKINSE